MEQQPRENEQKLTGTTWPKTAIIAIAILAIIVIFSFLQISSLKKEMRNSKEQVRVENPSQKNLDFALLFIDKVLQADKEVDFETRLQLENAVRNLNDKDILFQWQKFTSSTDEKNAQVEVRNLLKLVIEKAETDNK